MIEIFPNLFVGSEDEYDLNVRHQSGWRIVHACKEPYHRQALGYSGRAAANTHPEYLIARREHRLILNLVDVPDPSFIRKEIIDAALTFVDESLAAGLNTLVHCNKGESRAPSIGLLYLISRTDKLPVVSLIEAENAFKGMYPEYNPAAGMRGFMEIHFDTYVRK